MRDACQARNPDHAPQGKETITFGIIFSSENKLFVNLPKCHFCFLKVNKELYMAWAFDNTFFFFFWPISSGYVFLTFSTVQAICFP